MTQGHGDNVIELIDCKIWLVRKFQQKSDTHCKIEGVNHFRSSELFVNSESRNVFLVQNYPQIMCHTSLLYHGRASGVRQRLGVGVGDIAEAQMPCRKLSQSENLHFRFC